MYEQYTDKQIVEMLKPKLVKLGWGSVVNNDLYPDTCKMIAAIYRSAYIRGQLGRSFIIGEKKAKEPVNAFKVGDKVKFLGLNIEDEKAVYSRQFYPPVNTIGKIVEADLVYCVVRWPKNTTLGDGTWRCRHNYLKKVTEYWVPATKDNVKVGSKIRMIDGEMHNKGPRCFPVAGTVGIVKVIGPYSNCKVQWPRGTTSENDRWWSNYECLEVLLCE